MYNANSAKKRLSEIASCQTLCEIFSLRAKQLPDATALCQYNRQTKQWVNTSYSTLLSLIEVTQKAFASIALEQSSRVAVLLPNCVDAIVIDQAILANGLIPVPLHAIDTPGASAFILVDSQSSCLVTNKLERWESIEKTGVSLPDLNTVIFTDETGIDRYQAGIRIISKDRWLADAPSAALPTPQINANDLAGIIYTSGTTGKPKGVMLTHHNIVSNVLATIEHIAPAPGPDSVFLSFLPLSHTFERTAGYYLPLAMGCKITFNRSIALLGEDFKIVRPDVLISVPRIYEKIYAKINDRLSQSPGIARLLFHACVNSGWREFCRKNRLPVSGSFMGLFDWLVSPVLQKLIGKKILNQFGGNLHIAIAGGAALNQKVAKMFCGLGLPLIQGYGMTESSPIIAGNSLRINQPDTVGHVFTNLCVRLDPDTQEIQVKGPSVMKGYWRRPQDTAQVLSADGWLSTGDVGEFNSAGLLKIRGRIKEIIVTSTGEKIPPVDLELAIETDPLFAQAYIYGENRPFLCLVAVINPDEWNRLAQQLNVDPADPSALQSRLVINAVLKRAKQAAGDFPHYALPRSVILTTVPWTIDNGLLTPTLKLKRTPLSCLFKEQLEKVYESRN